MVQRLSPTAIANVMVHALVPKGHTLAATLWASLRGVASRAYAGLATTAPRGAAVAPIKTATSVARTSVPAPSRWTHTKLDADATHWRLTFAYHAQAVRLAAEAGFVFDPASRARLRPLDAPAGSPVLADPIDSRAAIEALLAHRAAGMARMAGAAEPIRAALKNIGVSYSDDRIRLTLPADHEHLVRDIVAIGGRPLAAEHGVCLEFEVPARSAEAGIFEALRDIDAAVGPAPARFARRTIPSPYPGIAVTSDGATLELRAADMPLRNLILRDLQPVYRPDRTIVVRLDIQQPGAVTGAVDRLAAYYRGLLVPPTSPANGVAISVAQLAGWERAPAASLATAWSPAADAMTMIERHFGSCERIAETAAAAGVDASVLERLQNFANIVTAARQELAQEQAMRSVRR